MYKIGELSKLCKLSVKTLRYYDSEGLLVPDRIDKFTGYRYYSASKLADCNRILALKELGFTLDEIKKQLSANETPAILALIAQKEQELIRLKTQTESQLQRLSAITRNITEGERNMANIVIKNSDSLRIAYFRSIFTSKNDAYQRIADIRKALPASILGKRNVLVNFETEYTEKDFDLGVGVEITGTIPKEYKSKNYAEKLIEFSSDTACLVCDKKDLNTAYSSIQRYIQNNHCQIVGAFYEIRYEDDTIELKVPVCRLTERAQTPRNDDIHVPFENDERVIGHWELIDCLPTREHFNENKMKSTGQKQIKDLYFLPGGEWYWCFGWTKGYVLSSFGYPHEQGLNRYTIESVNGKPYMFVEMKGSEYYLYNGRPEIWVFEQTDNKIYAKNEIRIKDDTNLPFIKDDQVLGKWLVCDLIKEIQDFNAEAPNPRFPHDALFWKSVEFAPGGNSKVEFGNGSAYEQPDYTWTKGFVLAHNSQIAEHYKILVFNGNPYLFIEWKSGDYTFGGEKPYYYVFKRA